MEANVRACVAYVAGTLISGRSPSTIFDYGRRQYIPFSGSVGPNSIAVYDHDGGSHFGGSGSGSRYSLYHYGHRHHVDLEVGEMSFSGYDYGTQSHFQGTVSGQQVTFYDYGTSQWFNFSL